MIAGRSSRSPLTPTGVSGNGSSIGRLTGAALIAIAPVVVSACAPPNGEGDAPAHGPDSTVVEGEGTREDAAAPVCLRGEPVVADGPVEVRDATPGDADRVSALRWHRHDGCERFVIDLAGRDGTPAERVGVVAAEVLRELGVARIALRDVEWVDPDATDATFDGALARAAYAVFSPEGRWVHVDVHLGGPAEVFVAALDEPARVVVDLRPNGGPVPEPAPVANRVVVLEPRPGRTTYPLTVTGYARTFEANVVVRLEQAGEDVYDDFTTATAWTDAWGHYSFTIREGPTGQVVLHVGEHSARDGSWEGVAVPLEVR